MITLSHTAHLNCVTRQSAVLAVLASPEENPEFTFVMLIKTEVEVQQKRTFASFSVFRRTTFDGGLKG